MARDEMRMVQFACQARDYSPTLTGFGRCDSCKHARPYEVHGRTVAAHPACLFRLTVMVGVSIVLLRVFKINVVGAIGLSVLVGLARKCIHIT